MIVLTDGANGPKSIVLAAIQTIENVDQPHRFKAMLLPLTPFGIIFKQSGRHIGIGNDRDQWQNAIIIIKA